MIMEWIVYMARQGAKIDDIYDVNEHVPLYVVSIKRCVIIRVKLPYRRRIYASD